jgi:putative ABC transport system permease protein
MLRTRWYKVISDLWSHRTRTLIVALAVAVGVYSVGSILAVQTLLLREFHRNRDSALIASAIIDTQPFDKRLAERIATMPGIAAAEGRSTVSARVVTSPDTWRNIDLVSVADFETMQVDRYPLVAGAWPSTKDEIMVEWMGLPYIEAEIGDTLTLEMPGKIFKTLKITGTAHNPQRPSPEIIGSTLGIVSPETMKYLGESPYFTEMHFRLTSAPDGALPDKETVRAAAVTVEDQIERSDREIYSTTIVGKSIIESIVNTAVMIVSTFGWVILLLSGFLVINTISALIAQQVNQIGIMKLVGASRGQMVLMYLTLVLVYGVLAFLIGIPLAVTTARLLMTNLIEGLMNLRSATYAVPLWVYAVMVAVGVLIPIGAGLLPVWQGTRISTYAALNDTGIHTVAGRGLIERLLAHLPKRWVQRPLTLAVRNTVRHKGRLLRTMIVLVLGTALFIAVLSVHQAVAVTQEDFLRYHQYDVQVMLQEPQRIARLEAAAKELPKVAGVEGWGMSSATRLRPDDSESNRYQIIGLPETTQMVTPVVERGRWLSPEDEYAIVLNATVAKDEPDIQVGDTIKLDFNDRKQLWTVVGFVSTDAQGPKIYMNQGVYTYETRTVGKANSLQVTLAQHDGESQDRAESRLVQQFEDKGMEVRSTRTTQTLNKSNALMFDIIVNFLIFMAVLLGAVGSLGLSTTMGINMMERIREIGVLRAIGASNGAIRKIVLLEGLVIAIISWLIGFALSFPTAQFMSAQIGIALLDMPLTYSYSMSAAIIWFFALIGLAIVASLGPAQNAVKLTIREVLAYE